MISADRLFITFQISNQTLECADCIAKKNQVQQNAVSRAYHRSNEPVLLERQTYRHVDCTFSVGRRTMHKSREQLEYLCPDTSYSPAREQNSPLLISQVRRPAPAGARGWNEEESVRKSATTCMVQRGYLTTYYARTEINIDTEIRAGQTHGRTALTHASKA